MLFISVDTIHLYIMVEVDIETDLGMQEGLQGCEGEALRTYIQFNSLAIEHQVQP